MSKSWTVTYRSRNNGQRITAAVFAADQQQALDKAYADGLIDGHEAWEVENIKSHTECPQLSFPCVATASPHLPHSVDTP